MTLVLVYVLVLLDTRGIPPNFLCKGTFLVRLKGTFSRHEFENQPSSDLHEVLVIRHHKVESTSKLLGNMPLSLCHLVFADTSPSFAAAKAKWEKIWIRSLQQSYTPRLGRDRRECEPRLLLRHHHQCFLHKLHPEFWWSLPTGAFCHSAFRVQVSFWPLSSQCVLGFIDQEFTFRENGPSH